MHDKEYSDAWMTGEAQAAEPAQDAAKKAAEAERDAADQEFSEAFKEATEEPEPPKAEPKLGLVPPAEEMSFKHALAMARQDGAPSFEWRGKKYATEPAKKAAPMGDA